MLSKTLADARDLIRWASSRRAQEELPVLVRRLIHATTSTASHIGLPAGDAVQQGGYDGVVVINERHHAVPEGMSIWEFGVSSNPKGKADDDYETRKSNQPHSAAGPVVPTSTAFVFVTARRWNAKTKWLKSRRTEGFWRDVRVLDVDDLEAWLEQAPAVHVWFSTLLGRRPAGADDLESAWRDWSESTTPLLTPQLMYAGREEVGDALRKWFTEETAEPTLGVESESPEESVALVAAAVMSLPLDARASVLSRAAIVRDTDSLVQLAATESPLRIVTTFEPGDLAHRATRGGHRVLIPRSPGEGTAGTLEVPRIQRAAAEQALLAMGLSEERAGELSGVARKSLMSLRRQLATSAAVRRPAWAAPEVGPSVLPIFLLGAVNEAVAGDADALALLAGETAPTAFSRLATLTAQSDPPVRRVGSVWYVVSKGDAWETLARYFTLDLLERFVGVAVGVLSAPDPSYDLPPEQRFAAGLFNKTRAHSGLLVKSIADTVALLGARGATHAISSGLTVADFSTQIVRQLLEMAGRDWRRWASFESVLPSLMEAAPDALLSAIESGLEGTEPSPILGLFGHDTGAFFSAPEHTGLLWALERVAWSPIHLGRAALILAELDRRDPGGRYSNRPAASLRAIFLPWLPGTAAPVEFRLAVIDTMRRREPVSAWGLLVALLPERSDTAFHTNRPDWQEWSPERSRSYNRREVAEHAVEMVRRMIEDAGASAERCVSLVRALDDVPAEAHTLIIDHLKSLADAAIGDDLRAAIWNALRELLSNHRSFSDATWALPRQRLDTIAEVLEKFEPSDLLVRDRYLFSTRPMLPEGRESDFEEHQRLVATRRVDAARRWYTLLGCAEDVVRIAGDLTRAETFGDALAESGVVRAEEEPSLIRCALEQSKWGARAFGRAYLAKLQLRRGPDAIPVFLQEHADAWPAATKAEALIMMPVNGKTWEAVDTLGAEGRTHYWRNVWLYQTEKGDGPRAMRELVLHDRPHAAVDLAATLVGNGESLPANDVAHALSAAAAVAQDVFGYRSERYDLASLISFLEKQAAAGQIDEQEVAQLELIYLPSLRYERTPKLLHKMMGRDPSLFVEAVCFAYPPEGDAERELDDGNRNRAHFSRELLESWRTPPGYENGVIDIAKLDVWVEAARNSLVRHDRASIGDSLIGQVLSGAPPGADGVWPAEPVREVIERLKSDDLVAGIHMGRFNSRGATTRDPLAGGAMERSIEQQYEADAAKVTTRWPRTAAILRSLARTYARDAMREDVQAELRHDLMD